MAKSLGRIGDFELLDELGRGGFGRVFRARDTRSGAIRALKVLDGTLDPDAVERFHREARALARFQGSGVVGVHASGVDRGRLWFAMDYMAGGSLESRIRAHPGGLEWREATAIVAKLAAALARIAAAGLVHRDVKPANVLFTHSGTEPSRCEPHLADLGCVRDLGASVLTQTGSIVGTLAYMAPEQLDGAHVEPRADVYALGLVFVELLTGRRLFQGNTPYALLLEIRSRRARFDAKALGVPEQLARTLDAMLAVQPAERATASRVAEELEALLRPASGGDRAPRSRLALAAGLFSLLVVAVALARRPYPPPPPVPSPRLTERPPPLSAPSVPVGSAAVVTANGPAAVGSRLEASALLAKLEGASLRETLEELHGLRRHDVDDGALLATGLARKAAEQADFTTDFLTVARLHARARDFAPVDEPLAQVCKRVSGELKARYRDRSVEPSDLEEIVEVVLGFGSPRIAAQLVELLAREAVFSLKNARAQLSRLLEGLPRSCGARYTWGVFLYRLGEEREGEAVRAALRELEAAASLATVEANESVRIQALWAVAHALARSGEAARGLDVLRDVRAPLYARSHRLRAHCLVTLGRPHEDIVGALEEGLSIVKAAKWTRDGRNPNVEKLEALLAVVKSRQGDWRERLAAFSD